MDYYHFFKKNAFIKLVVNLFMMEDFNRHLQKIIHQLVYPHMNFFVVKLINCITKYHLNCF